jgi:hypothetical protein
VRSSPEGAPERVLVLSTLGAPERRRLRGRRGTLVRDAEPAPVPTSRVTVITPEPFRDRSAAEEWLGRLRAGGAHAEVGAAVSVVNRALHAHRAARADPAVRDITADQALVVRVGFGGGDTVAEGRYEEAWELPRARRAPGRRSMEAPDERFAALLGASESVLVCEELVLRARADLDAGRSREAALQARVALESLLAELTGDLQGDRRAALEADREPVGEAANAALVGPLPDELDEAVRSAVGRMEAALRARRLAGG